MTNRHPWLAAFFAFGAAMCTLTMVLLLFPGTPFDVLWRVNPEARRGFDSLGMIAFPVMVVVGTACGFAATGLWRGTRWGVRLAIVILTLNLAGDLFNALMRHDYRGLVGLPIASAMIVYLIRSR